MTDKSDQELKRNLNLLNGQIVAHEKHDRSESDLSWFVNSLCGRHTKSNQSLEELKNLKQKAENQLHSGDKSSYDQTNRNFRLEGLLWREHGSHS